jgi:7-cyano-7-deazaguanine reductase
LQTVQTLSTKQKVQSTDYRFHSSRSPSKPAALSSHGDSGLLVSMPKKNLPKAITFSERPAARRTEPLASAALLDTFENAHADRDYLIHIQIPEFTCHCPLTGQPDFAHITIDYIPDKRCIELKALKLYMWSFRDIGAFHEKVTNDICDVLAKAIKPRYMRVTGRWNVRGGIYTNVVAEHRAKGWKPLPKVDLTAFGLANPAAI